MKALILLGGFGTRLRPLTCTTPKPLLSLVNRPALNYQIDLLKKHNVKEIIFCMGYMSDSFNKYYGTGKKFGVKLHYVYEKSPLGTGGAIKNAYKYVGNDLTYILIGDTLTDIDLTQMLRVHQKNHSDITLALVRVKDPTVYGLVEVDKNNRIERFLEKPSWDEITCNTINAGIYLFNPEVYEYIPDNINYSVERELFPFLLSKKKKLMGFVSSGYWLDIGTPEKYLQANFDLLKNRVKFSIPGLKNKNNVTIDGKLAVGNNTAIDDYIQFTGLISIGNKCVIKKGAQIADSVILDNVHIGEGVKMDRAIVGENSIIESYTVLSPGTIVAPNSHIKKYSRL